MALSRTLGVALIAAAAAGGAALAQPAPAAPPAASPAAPSAPAQLPPTTLDLRSFDPDAAHQDHDHFAFGVHVTTDAATTAVGYTDDNAAQIDLVATNGQALLGGGTNAKRTFLPLLLDLTGVGSGQRIGFADLVTCYGMSDCAAESQSVTYANGPVAGDEGESLTTVDYVRQQDHLVKTTVTAAEPRSRCDTAVAEDVRASQAPQAVAVADASGCQAGDWVVLNAERPTNAVNQSAMRVESVAGGRITGVFDIYMRRGQKVTPATVIRVADTAAFGQDRVLVNHARAAYAVGAVAAINGYTFSGKGGAAWSEGMVGGSALDPGCIMLTADAYAGPPFGPGPAALESWYEIGRVTSPTSLEIYSTSVANDATYRGRGPGDGGYQIAPCARILRIEGAEVVLNSNSFAWAPGDAVEEPITPYADSSGYQLHMGAYANGGTLRAGYSVTNVGARTFGAGLFVQSNMRQSPDADAFAWKVGVGIENAETGVVQFGGENGFAAEGVTRNGFAAYTPGAQPSPGAGLFLAGFDYGVQLAGRDGAAFTVTSTANNHSLTLGWPQFTANRAVSFPDQSGVVALALAATTGRIGGAPLSAGACASADVAVPGATTTMTAVVSAGGGVDPGPGFMPKAWVSAPGRVSVAVCALAAGAPAPTVYNVRVIQ